MPEGYSGEGFLQLSMNSVVGLARKNSIWPLLLQPPAVELNHGNDASHYDFARFGAERLGFSPRQCDLLMVMGTIAKKMGPIVKTGLFTNGRPRWVVAVGACALPVEYLIPIRYYRELTR